MEYVNKIQELIIAHPRLFKHISTRSQSDLSQGWYKLVDELCQQINFVITDDELANFEVLQIKEKFGSLRFYFNASEKMRPRINLSHIFSLECLGSNSHLNYEIPEVV